MLLDDLRAFVRANVDPHLQGLWSPDCETQLLFANEKENRRIPKDGNGAPQYYDTAYYPPLASLRAVGVSGWNYVDGRSYHVTIDLDGVNHAAGHEQHVLDDLVAQLCLLDQVEIIHSKSGLGYHLRVYFDPEGVIRVTRGIRRLFEVGLGSSPRKVSEGTRSGSPETVRRRLATRGSTGACEG